MPAILARSRHPLSLASAILLFERFQQLVRIAAHAGRIDFTMARHNLAQPPRYFTAAQVAELGQALSRPELEAEAAARFDAARMSQLQIYPGWRPSDAEWVMDSLRRLRDFYSDAAKKRQAIVTCLV